MGFRQTLIGNTCHPIYGAASKAHGGPSAEVAEQTTPNFYSC